MGALTKSFIKKRFSSEEYSSFMEYIEEGFPACRQQFQTLVDTAIARIKKCNPRILLCVCAYRLVGYKISKHNDTEECKWRAIEFIQNILVTHKSIPEPLSENDMIDLCVQVTMEVEDLYLEFMKIVVFVDQMIPERIRDKDERSFILQAALMYIVRGKRDISFQDRYFSLLLSKQDDNLKNELGMSAEAVISGIEKLCRTLYFSKANSFSENLKLTAKEYRARKHKKNGLEQAIIAGYKRANQDALDLAPYDVEAITGWPRNFISIFSLPLAERDVEVKHDYQFWPYDDFITKRRPFVELDGHFYCFDYYTFVDNIYHGLFKACIANEGEFGHKWSDAQTEAIEEGVAEVFQKLLPGCSVYRNLKYKKPGAKDDTGELDVVVVCSGLFIVIETKGMEYFQDSPILHPEKVLDFYNRSVKRAGVQTRRFVEYVNKAKGQVILKNKSGDIVIKSDKGALGRICRVCVLSDSTNELLACTNKLETIKIDAQGLICIALDDLLVYEKYFERAPMLFMAYLSSRLDASFAHKVIASDELDHLGFYISNPNYVNEVLKYDSEVDFMSIDDNRRELDEFFLSLRYPEINKPTPYIPNAIQKLLDQVWESSTKNKLEIATFIMQLARGEKDWLAKAIDDELFNQRASGVASLRGMPADQSAGGVGVSLLINSLWAVPMPYDVWFARIQGLMTKFHEAKRLVFCLNYDPSGGLLDCSLKVITVDQFEERLKKAANNFVKAVDRRVVARAVQSNRVGRNSQCPCGSGKKYKKCCGK